MEVEGCFLRLFTEILFGPLFRYRMRTKTFKNSIEDRFVSQTLKLHRSNHRSSISIKSSKLHSIKSSKLYRSNHRSSTDQIFSPPPNDDPPNELRNRIHLRNLALTALVAGCTAHTNTTCTRTRSLTPNFGGFLVGIRG